METGSRLSHSEREKESQPQSAVSILTASLSQIATGSHLALKPKGLDSHAGN